MTGHAVCSDCGHQRMEDYVLKSALIETVQEVVEHIQDGKLEAQLGLSFKPDVSADIIMLVTDFIKRRYEIHDT